MKKMDSRLRGNDELQTTDDKHGILREVLIK